MLKALYYPGDQPFDSLFIPAIYHEIYYDGIYMDIMNVLDRTKKDPVIVDVGSNIGVTVQHFKDHAKKVYAIEPGKANFEALKANVEKNGWDNVEIFNIAISNEDGEAELRIYSPNTTSNSIVFKPNPGEKVEKVPTKKFTTFFKENGITHVDFCKADIEGAEQLLIPSDDFAEACKIVDCWIFEFHFDNYPDLVNRMIKLGYTARKYDCGAIVICFTK